MKISVRAPEDSVAKNANRNGVEGMYPAQICGMWRHTVSFTRLTILYTITLKAVLITLQLKFKYFRDMQYENFQEIPQSNLFFSHSPNAISHSSDTSKHLIVEAISRVHQSTPSKTDFPSNPKYIRHLSSEADPHIRRSQGDSHIVRNCHSE